MDELIKTGEMKKSPVRVPVMIEKDVAGNLARYLLEQDRSLYDATIAKVITLGIQQARAQK